MLELQARQLRHFFWTISDAFLSQLQKSRVIFSFCRPISPGGLPRSGSGTRPQRGSQLSGGQRGAVPSTFLLPVVAVVSVLPRLYMHLRTHADSGGNMWGREGREVDTAMRARPARVVVAGPLVWRRQRPPICPCCARSPPPAWAARGVRSVIHTGIQHIHIDSGSDFTRRARARVWVWGCGGSRMSVTHTPACTASRYRALPLTRAHCLSVPPTASHPLVTHRCPSLSLPTSRCPTGCPH